MFSKIKSLEKNLEKKGKPINDKTENKKAKVVILELNFIILLIFWFLLDSWINILDIINNKLLKKAWNIKNNIL